MQKVILFKIHFSGPEEVVILIIEFWTKKENDLKITEKKYWNNLPASTTMIILGQPDETNRIGKETKN